MLDPDEAIQQAVRLLFTLFEHQGSALAVVKQFANQRLRFPTRPGGHGAAGDVCWQPLSSERVLDVLHNPT